MLSRRQVLSGAAAAAGAAAVGAVASRFRGTAPERRPSVVVVLVDDMRFDYRGLLTVFDAGPWIDCTGAAAQTPICAPSRASLLTGSYAWRTPVVGNDSAPAMVRIEGDTVATRLAGAGYRAALVGKYQNQYPFDLGADHVPPGWSDWAALGSTAWNPGQVHETDHCFAWASDFVASVDPAQPFLLWVAPQLPHDPYRPPSRYRDVAVTVPPEPPSVDEREVATKPPFVRMKPRVTTTERAGYRTTRRLQAQDMLAIDDGMRQLVTALQRAGRWDSTVVIFTSDNSLTLGEHRLANKGFPYEESVHVPFVVHLPGVARRVETQPISLVDVPVTIGALTGAGAPGPDGVDLAPLLTGGQSVRDGAYLTPPDNLFWEGVRTARYKYVEYEHGFHELYDLSVDPYELTNLAGRGDHKGVQRQLADLLQDLRP
ncbi:MAG TPA: sulfatase-like hydrolase/transferase [Acidimicrobiales bacterium]